jgi:uncharacterized protein
MLAHNVSTLLKSPLGTTRDVEIDEPNPQFGSDLVAQAPARGTARLHRIQNAIIAVGDVSTAVEVECARCLEPFALPVSVHFEEEFRPTINILTGVPAEPAEDAALQIDEHHVLDLTEITRQYILTALPLNPGCRPDCAGLCPKCGADLNQGPCDCPSDEADIRLAALAALLRELDPAAGGSDQR